MERTNLSESKKREILTEAGFRCAVPTCRSILTLNIHHIVEVSKGGGNESSNLLCLCPNCHSLYHQGNIPQDSIRCWKNMLVALNGAFDKETISNLLFLKKLPRHTLALSGDGILKFSHLISADLARFQILIRNGPIIVYEIFLTDKGNQLVEAWIKGEELQPKEALKTTI